MQSYHVKLELIVSILFFIIKKGKQKRKAYYGILETPLVGYNIFNGMPNRSVDVKFPPFRWKNGSPKKCCIEFIGKFH